MRFAEGWPRKTFVFNAGNFQLLIRIMVDICHAFADELFGKGGYINAFRVYVREKLDDNSISGVRVKVLPFAAIQQFNSSLDNVLEKTECYLEKRVG